MNTFTINGVAYKAMPVDFNMVCEFEDAGLSFDDLGKKMTSFVRGYFSICAGISIAEAGNQIQEHILKGGNLVEITTAFTKEIESSDFFRTLKENTEKNAPKSKK